MNHWLENSKKNLVPLSVASDFHDALAEWRFTGAVIDYDEDEDIICQLCGHAELANHFEISNKLNGNTLLIGSRCILKFQEIEVRDITGAVMSDQAERQFYLQEAVREKRRERAIEPLRFLWKEDKEHRVDIERHARILKAGGGISPAALLFLFRRMEVHGIAFQAELFKISLKAFHEPGELARMTPAERSLIKPALSSAQLRRHAQLFKEGPFR